MEKMEIEIESEKENKPLGRTEILFRVKDARLTPARQELARQIAVIKSVATDQVIVERITQRFGDHEATGTAHVYADAKKLKLVERPYLQARGDKEKKKALKDARKPKPKPEKNKNKKK